jgi:HrpA-like RNA helicase
MCSSVHVCVSRMHLSLEVLFFFLFFFFNPLFHLAQEFLARAPEPPESRHVRHAIELLQTMGALRHDETVTPLGSVLLRLSVDPFLGKVLVMGVVMRCLDPVLTIVATIAAGREIFRDRRKALRVPFADKKYAHNHSVVCLFGMSSHKLTN